VIEKGFTRLPQEKDEYIGKGSGFTLKCIDGLHTNIHLWVDRHISNYLKISETKKQQLIHKIQTNNVLNGQY
jgi:hypothetical protein